MRLLTGRLRTAGLGLVPVPAHGLKLDRALAIGSIGVLFRQSDGLIDLHQLSRSQVAPRARRDSLEVQRSEPGPPETRYRNADGVHHASHNVVQPFVDDDAHGYAFTGLAKEPDFLRHDLAAIEDNTVAQALELALSWSCIGEDEVLLVDSIARVHHAVREIAVVGKEHETLGVSIEAADGIDALADINEIHDGPAVSLIAYRGDKPGGLVQHDMPRWLPAKCFAVDPDLIPVRVHPSAQLRDDPAVDLNPASDDHLFRSAT